MNRCKHNSFLCKGKRWCVGFRVVCQKVFDFLKSCLCCLCRLDHLREEDLSLFKFLSHHIQRRDELGIDDLFRFLAGKQCSNFPAYRFGKSFFDTIGQWIVSGFGRSRFRSRNRGSNRFCADAGNLFRAAEVFDIARGVLIQIVQHLEGANRIKHRWNVRGDDRQIQTSLQRHEKEAVI